MGPEGRHDPVRGGATGDPVLHRHSDPDDPLADAGFGNLALHQMDPGNTAEQFAGVCPAGDPDHGLGGHHGRISDNGRGLRRGVCLKGDQAPRGAGERVAVLLQGPDGAILGAATA